jgi:hypothetical protein
MKTRQVYGPARDNNYHLTCLKCTLKMPCFIWWTRWMTSRDESYPISNYLNENWWYLVGCFQYHLQSCHFQSCPQIRPLVLPAKSYCKSPSHTFPCKLRLSLYWSQFISCMVFSWVFLFSIAFNNLYSIISFFTPSHLSFISLDLNLKQAKLWFHLLVYTSRDILNLESKPEERTSPLYLIPQDTPAYLPPAYPFNNIVPNNNIL